MKKRKGYDAPAKVPKKKYAVLLGGRLVAETWAVSAEKAINNVRWNYYISQYDFSYEMEDFDAVEMN